MPATHKSFVWGAAVLSLLGCSDLSEYEGRFQGGVVGADEDDCPSFPTCSFIRRGFPEGTQLVLDDFTPPPRQGSLGTLTTTPYAAFAATPLELIAPLEHDQLSLYDFPGGGRLRNYIFVTRPETGPLAGRDAMVFLSLMEDEDIELRIVVGSGNETRGDHFGLFQLERE